MSTSLKKSFTADLISNKWGLDAPSKELNFPTNKDEYWKYLKLHPLTKSTFNQLGGFKDAPLEILSRYKEYNNIIVFVDGHYSEVNSTFNSPFISVLSKEPSLQKYTKGLIDVEDNVFSSLNYGYASDGFFIKIEKDSLVKEPILVLNVLQSNETACILKNNIVVQQGAQASLIFESITAKDNTTCHANISFEFELESKAVLDFYNIQQINETSSIIETVGTSIAEASNFSTHYISTGGSILRNNIKAKFNGPHAVSTFNGVILGDKKNQIDHHTLIDHQVPNCESHETYKIIGAGNSTSIFNGKVFVRENAQKTNAFQSSQGILLSNNAGIYAKPELEIYADDVKCSHGSTTGQLDLEALFYLKSRGISEQTAKQMLIHAFVGEVTQQITNNMVRERFIKIVESFFTKL